MLQTLAPWFGYLATLLLAIALIVGSDLKFRWLSAAGNITFVIYGWALHAPPVMLTNFILLMINVFFLYRLYNKAELFETISFDTGGLMIEKFLAFYKDDIASYFPEFSKEKLAGNINFVVLRNLVIANIFSIKPEENGVAEVYINYTVKKFRDYKVGLYLFKKEKQLLISKGVETIYYKTVANKQHRKFLIKMGFTTATINGKDCLMKKISD